MVCPIYLPFIYSPSNIPFASTYWLSVAHSVLAGVLVVGHVHPIEHAIRLIQPQ